nr:MAG TPA: hypothetical protein [Caudoviricetes sp.]DAT91570.1 MAG TPA: hypothetical protein [Caudoviricetes sp.]
MNPLPRRDDAAGGKGEPRKRAKFQLKTKITSYLGISQALPPRGSTPRLATKTASR